MLVVAVSPKHWQLLNQMCLLNQFSIAQTLAVTESNVPAQPAQIFGNTTVCHSSNQTYTISPVAGATSYIWTLPSGWGGTSTTTSITVTIGANSGTITVKAHNLCGSSPAQTLAVSVNSIPAFPGPITGTSPV